ncbi:porin [Cupriavidus alkaliphilus]|uniref:porin n=1 Tax=Cupriavidus alkaliphilus TaxID=942866 RepID=UPI00161051E1|nr:porin [Cupriavidus alkaliphilus]MBB2919637.1 putative porin [Cupriavidus alkaliphilus]
MLEARHCLKHSLTLALLAGLAASATAHADGVRLYGLIDTYVGSIKPSGAPRSSWQLDNGGETTPFWGMGGEEDLGGGLSTVFAIESFFRPDTGEMGRSPVDAMFARNAYVGLSSNKFGELRIGRNSTPMLYLTGQFNPFAGSTRFSPLNVQNWIPTFGRLIRGDTGWSNAVRYLSPNFGGLSFQLIYGLGEAATNNGTNNMGAMIRYQNGPLDLAVGGNHTKTGAAITALEPSQKVLFTGASYDFKVLKLFGTFNMTKNGRSEVRTYTYQAGVSAPLGPGRLNASYAWTRNDRRTLDDFNRTTAAIGYSYDLSKRTDVYANYLYDKLTTAGTGNTFGVGLRHKF